MSKKIMIFGDICPDNDYRTLFDKRCFFSPEILSDISNSDLVIANLECPATECNTPIKKCGPTLKAHMSDIELLKDTGFDILSLANNHILDYGDKGVKDTIDSCKKAGIKYVGAGNNSQEAAVSVVTQIDDSSIGIISFAEEEFNCAYESSPGANMFDPYSSFDIVGQLKEKCDYLIVLYHGGIEYYKNPSPLLQKKCRKFVERGADLVLCQHSHCVGTVETHCNSTILYGQGNSFFGYRGNSDSWNEGMVVFVDLDAAEKVSYKLLRSTENIVEYAPKDESEERINRMISESKMLSDCSWINEQWREYCSTQVALDLPLLYGKNRVFIKLNRIFKNRLVSFLYSRRKYMITMNLLRCDAHREVVKNILENEVYK